MGCIIPGLRDRDLKKTGISRYGFISTAEILFSDAVRKICENDTCRLYGRTWAVSSRGWERLNSAGSGASGMKRRWFLTPYTFDRPF